jgi:hypothetical protein
LVPNQSFVKYVDGMMFNPKILSFQEEFARSFCNTFV